MNNIIINEIAKEIGVDFVQRYHYSKILPRLTKHYLGLFIDNELAGVIMLGWGTQPLQTIKKIFYKHDLITTDYIEIGKMCFLPKYNGTQNFGSQAIKALKQYLSSNTSYKFLYTLADGIMGKCGFVYQASNFYYIGKFKTSVYMDIYTREKIHPRSAKALCIENAQWENKDKVFWLTDSFCKYKGIDKINGLMFRYMMPLDKKSRKIILQYPEYINNSNPKEEDLYFGKRIENGKFKTIKMPDFNMDIFEHNYQKY